jgi:hypothetical protein
MSSRRNCRLWNGSSTHRCAQAFRNCANSTMIKKVLTTVLALGGLLVGVALAMYVTNSPPKVERVSPTESGRPFVVKLHARWCAVCALTKPAWSDLEKTYSTSVNLVVFDFTNSTTTEASRNEARRIGLEPFFDEYGGGTGIVAVLDGRTKKVLTVLEGHRSRAEYHAAIDAALKPPPMR